MTKTSSLNRSEKWWIFGFTAPAILLLLVFKIYPILISFVGSFYAESFMQQRQIFVGFENYISLFKDLSFWQSMKATVIFNVITTPLQILISLILALTVKRNITVINIYRNIFIAPIAIALATACIIWNILLNPNMGVVNSLLGALGIPAQPFFTSPSQAMMGVIIICVWKGCGYWMLFLLSGLQGISESIYESATIDGAGPFRTLWSITLPLLTRSLAFVFVSNTISNLLMFAPMHMITLGGPQMSTNLLMYEAYKSGFTYQDFGRSYAIVTLLIIFAVLIVAVEMRIFKPKH